MSEPATEALVHEYFRLAAGADREAWLALFAPDVRVVDDGQEYAGVDQVRAWSSEVPAVTYVLLELRSAGPRASAVARVSGDFPGSPVELPFTFAFDAAGRISELRINEAPAS